MEGIIAIAVIWFVINILTKGMKATNQSGRNQRSGQSTSAPPGGMAARPRPPLTPTVRPGSTGAPDWSDIMTMLSGAQPQSTNEQEDMEGVSTESGGSSGSLTGPSMMEGASSMFEGPRMMDGSQPMMDAIQPDYEGATLPGELSADAVAMLPKSEETVSPPLRSAFQPKRYDPAAMRDAVVWAEILAKPKSLRRVAR